MHQRNLIAQNPAGGFVNVKADHNGKLSTDALKSSSGETVATSLTPVIQETFQYTVNSRVWNIDTSNGGTVTHDNAKAVLSTGTAEDSYAEIISKKRIKCRAGMGVVCRFTAVWEEGKGADYVSFIGVIDEDSKNGLLFLKDTDGMSIEHYNDSKVVGSIAQADWDDPCDGTSIMPVMDWSKGNVFEIRYQHLGYGAIKFSIENPDTGLFQLVHTIKYANANEEPPLSNSTLPFRVYISNTQTGTVNTKIKTASVVCFVEGENKINDTIKNIYTRDIKATTTENAVFTIRNNNTFNSIENNSIVYPTYLSVSNTDTETAIIWLTETATLEGVTDYVDLDNETSVVAIDEGGTTISAGDIILSILVGAGSTERINLREYNIEIQPGNTLTISSASDANTSNIIYTIGWVEDQV